jgi:hypothetical protein
LCVVVYGRERRAVQPAEGVSLCVECIDRCNRGVGAAEAARRCASLPPPDHSERILARLGTLHSLGIAHALP